MTTKKPGSTKRPQATKSKTKRATKKKGSAAASAKEARDSAPGVDEAHSREGVDLAPPAETTDETAAPARGPTRRRASQRPPKPDDEGATRTGSVLMTAAPGTAVADFPIVALGASAGGLEAFERFFSTMPADSGMAFVLVAHLDPGHVSILPELLQKRTEMRVRQITDGLRVEPNEVYVIPPNKALGIIDGVLQLLDITLPRGSNMPIDGFFRSLAQDQGPLAIGIVLSGTGSDGTLGLRAIKGEAGLVMTQDEESAKYEGMPRSAIATQLADFVLPPCEMPARLLEYADRVRGGRTVRAARATESQGDTLQKVFLILRDRTGHDFSLYKKNTLCRRIERRMHLQQIDGIADYVRFLQDSDREADVLFKELLIGVTSFFRDAAAFDLLRDTAIAQQLAEESEDRTYRVWVPGCATGEEAYSIAIVLQEAMERLGRHMSVQIFGTDIDEEAIGHARAGRFQQSILADVGPERLRRFFSKEDDGYYRIKKTIREQLVFAPQNIIKNPPFTKLDLLSCRNLLIYLGAELQQKLLPTFHYGLRPNGVLFLGSSESIGTHSRLFAPIDTKWKLFRRVRSVTRGHPTLDYPSALTPRQHAAQAPDGMALPGSGNVLAAVEAILNQTDMSPCAVVNEDNTVVYFHGRTGRYLEPPRGEASVNIVAMARPGLKDDLAEALRRVAMNRQQPVRRTLEVRHNGGSLALDMTVKSLALSGSSERLTLVVFDEHPAPEAPSSPARPGDGKGKEGKKNAEALEQELQSTRESLQTTIEELETSNEELKSINEELQSTNEELQSTNEELETSKEELQSLNEESATVNAELRARIDELSKANDDIRNLLNSTNIATIFLDADLRIRRFTPTATALLPLSPPDVGRPLGHLASTLIDVDLVAVSRRVLDDLAPQESEVEDKTGRIHLMVVRPYRTTANVIDGVVITFRDITEHKRLLHESQRTALLVETAVKVSPFKLVVAQIDTEARYTWVHDAHGVVTGTEILGKRDDEIADNQPNRELRRLKETVLASGNSAMQDIRFPTDDGESIHRVAVEPILDDQGRVTGATTSAVELGREADGGDGHGKQS